MLGESIERLVKRRGICQLRKIDSHVCALPGPSSRAAELPTRTLRFDPVRGRLLPRGQSGTPVARSRAASRRVMGCSLMGSMGRTGRAPITPCSNPRRRLKRCDERTR